VFSFTTTALFDSEYSEGGFVAIFMCILFAHENLAFRVGDFLWRAKAENLGSSHSTARVSNAAIREKVRVMNAEFLCAESMRIRIVGEGSSA
jgi:hypothetical protein